MTIIEQAAKRLEALRQAGVAVPWSAVNARPDGVATAAITSVLTPQVSAVHAAPAKPLRPLVRARPVQVNLERLAKLGYITPELPHELEQLAAEFRIIKRPLMKAMENAEGAPTKRSNLIMITSAVPGEGKSFTAINLAMSIAMEVDRTVLLVDADVIRPSVLERCGLEQSIGLLDLLTNPDMALGDALLKTNVPKLTLLPPGTPRPNATELLASATMDNLLEELATRYPDRVIVFDAPPLLPSPESRVLASRVGQVVVVVEQGGSDRTSVQQAFATVQACPNVTSIFNKCRERNQGSLYGNYYYGAQKGMRA